MNRFELHVKTWENCTRCEYSERRKKVVLGKGQLPCDVLFIAEGPGDSEDVLGIPMIAQAGRLMDQILVRAGIVTPKNGNLAAVWDEDAVWKYTVSFTNLVGCIPYDVNREKEKEPDAECVLACKPRLEEWIVLAEPKLIVLIGKPAREWFEPGMRDSIQLPHKIPTVEIDHPAFILRKPFVERGVAVQQATARIRIGIRDHITNLLPENPNGTDTKPVVQARRKSLRPK